MRGDYDRKWPTVRVPRRGSRHVGYYGYSLLALERITLSSDAPVTGLVRLTGDCVDGVGQSEGDLLCQICSSHLTLSSLTTLSIN